MRAPVRLLVSVSPFPCASKSAVLQVTLARDVCFRLLAISLTGSFFSVATISIADITSAVAV